MALPETIPFSSLYTLVALDARILPCPKCHESAKQEISTKSQKGNAGSDQ
jgi:hypothetical protein